MYDNIYFENGIKDKEQHPVVIAGQDERYLYCFTMTSQLKHISKNSYARNIYNENIYYVKTIPGRNCQIRNEKKGLIITSHCFAVPIEEIYQYENVGYLFPATAKEVIIKWAYQQNEIKDKKTHNYDKLCQAFGINETVKQTEIYKYCVALMSNYPEEIKLQREYAKELRIHNEKCREISLENKRRYEKNEPRLRYPKPPKLADDRTLIEKFLYENFQSSINPFDELNKLYKDEQSVKDEDINIIELKEYKDQLLKLKENQSKKSISHEKNIQEQQYEEQDSQSQYRRAA